MTGTPTCGEVAGQLAPYLHRTLPPSRLAAIRDHLDGCDACWSQWNLYRWDAANGHALLAELRQFLGTRFRPYFDSSRALQAEWVAAAPATAEQRQEFFGRTESYLYNLVIWHASGNRPPYVAAAVPLLPAGCRILDFGAGIGQDAIDLTQLGHEVIACDVPGQGTEFLRWRVEQRGLRVEVRPPQRLTSGAWPDTLWIIDTLDHLPDIDAALGGLLQAVDRVICENLHVTRNGGQGFHERRSLAVIAQVFSRYGLHPAPGTAADILTVFIRLSPASPSGPPSRAAASTSYQDPM